MGKRLNYKLAAPGAPKAIGSLDDYVETTKIEDGLRELVRIHASQINGCAFCVDMHTIDARAKGESEQRIYALPVWREAPFFSARERAALLWTEKITQIAIDHVPDEVYEEVKKEFSDKDLVDLTMVVAAINVWNRVGVAFRLEAGHYKRG